MLPAKPAAQTLKGSEEPNVSVVQFVRAEREGKNQERAENREKSFNVQGKTRAMILV